MQHTEHHLQGNLEAPARSRRIVERCVGDHPRRHEVVLAVSEIVTNAVTHGAPHTAESGLTLGFEADDRRLRFVVAHRGPKFDADVDRSFHGLGIVARVVDRWGIAEHGDHVQVWFEIDHPPNGEYDGGGGGPAGQR